MNLQDKAINIKGKSYVLVSDRVLAFNEAYPNGSIITELKSAPDASMVVVKAKVTPDVANLDRYFTGYSQATWGDGMVNKTAALENCETSAVGRALGMMGIGVLDSIASADEVKKAITQPAYNPAREDEPIDEPEYDVADNALCHIHVNDDGSPVRMNHYQNTKGEWWSHKLPNGSYCNGRANKTNGGGSR